MSALSWVRSPVGFGPPDGEIDENGTYDYRRRLTQIFDMNDDFKEPGRLQFRQKAHIASEPANAAIEEIIRVRGELIVALRMKINVLSRGPRFGRPLTEEDIARDEQRDAVIWEGYGDNDQIKLRLVTAVSDLEKNLLPLIRLEK